jgi:ABC-type uncharacterized transport system permease subunit
LVYRADLVFWMLSIFLQVYLLKMVWRAVYAGRPSIDGLELDRVVAFLTLANLQLFVLSPQLAWFFQGRVREGQVATDLARPLGLIRQLIAYQLGISAAELPFVLAALPFAFVVGGLQPPASVSAGVLYLVSLVLAYVILVLISVLLALVSLWTLEITGMTSIYRFVSSFFAGAFIPLWFFPDALRAVANVLPFQTQAFIPLSIYVGQLTGTDALQALGLQLAWVAIFVLLAHLAWQRTLRHVIVQGG